MSSSAVTENGSHDLGFMGLKFSFEFDASEVESQSYALARNVSPDWRELSE